MDPELQCLDLPCDVEGRAIGLRVSLSPLLLALQVLGIPRRETVCLRFMSLEHLAAAVAWKAPMLGDAGPGSTGVPGPAL